MKRLLVLSLLAAACAGDAHETEISQSTATFGPPIAQNPWAAIDFATQHGDTGASDTSTLPGPGVGTVAVERLDLLAACPSIFLLRSGRAVAVCTKLLNQTPTVVLFDPEALTTVTTRALARGSLFGGVYPYLDERERLVVVDGENNLLRIDTQDLHVEQTIALGLAGDHVVGLIPDYEGRDWFASEGGVIGTVTREGMITTLHLGERMQNSIASAPSGIAVISDQALYLFSAGPTIRARIPYDRGAARKPGQLSWGSGTTPTYFGPRTGSDYVAITDNALPLRLIVVRNDGSPVCTLALPGIDGTENSPIGAGRSVFVASTYGYAYPALPADAGPSAEAPFVGGIARVDVEDDGCRLVWSAAVRSVAVPKLSLADGLIYTVAQRDDGFAYTALDAADGMLLAQQPLGEIAAPMQLAATIAAGRTLFQGTTTSIVRIRPAQR
ncbi:MAG TPA: hypothetical protein VFX59_14345 [Polyangiales bacterium]|nr:hypothetical protein [Polyangiales bacterium]